MLAMFRPYCPSQGLLLLPDMRDWPPEGLLAYPAGIRAEAPYLSPNPMSSCGAGPWQG